jgi:hypothetical protein
MGMRPSDNDIDRETREAQIHADAVQRALAVHAVTKWNKLMERSAARHKPGWSPMVGVAVAAKFYFLDVFCPSCRQLKQVDLRTLDRHERTTLHALIPMLSCRSCQPQPPFARPVRLSQHEWESENGRRTRQKEASESEWAAQDPPVSG